MFWGTTPRHSGPQTSCTSEDLEAILHTQRPKWTYFKSSFREPWHPLLHHVTRQGDGAPAGRTSLAPVAANTVQNSGVAAAASVVSSFSSTRLARRKRTGPSRLACSASLPPFSYRRTELNAAHLPRCWTCWMLRNRSAVSRLAPLCQSWWSMTCGSPVSAAALRNRRRQSACVVVNSFVWGPA